MTKPLLARTPRLGFSSVPKHWFGGSVAATQLVNGVNLLFPAGERFFVRSVRHYLARLDDGAHTALASQVRGFFGQEGRHAQAHERFFDTLREQGYDIDSILDPYESFVYGRMEKRFPPALLLASTVALEHFTAILAEDALLTRELDDAHPVMRQLLEWHALEELEHKAVAFDVLQAVHPSYALRIAGLGLAAFSLGAYWLLATRALLAQDGVSLLDAARELRSLREDAVTRGKAPAQSIFRHVFLGGMLAYLRPGFHPNDRDHTRLAAEALARLTAEGVVDGVPAGA